MRSEDPQSRAAKSAAEALSPEAVAATERALRELLELVGEDADAHHHYARFLAGQGRNEAAAAEFRRALELRPEFPEALRHLAALLCARREFADAITLLRRVVAIRPDDVQALCDLGNALVNVKGGREAAVFLLHALRLAPDEYRLHSNLGLAYTEAGDFAQAEAAFREALRIKPMFVPAHNNLANLYIVMGRHEEALACLELAENLERGNLITICNRAIALLSMGDFARGWRDYQRRWDRPQTPHRAYAQPLWTGQSLEGRRILLYTDEGLGDRIQFIRYAGLLKSRGARVICECPMPLMDVFRTAHGVDELVQLGNALPVFDLHAPLLGLPHAFATTLENVPAPVPYLAPEPERVAQWRRYFSQRADAGTIGSPVGTSASQGGAFLVGIAWQGNPNHQWDRLRSMPLMQFEALAAIPGVRLVSLQRGPGIEQIGPFQRMTGNRMIVPTAGEQSTPGDLADTTAILECLDLVVTVDTATAHLAGALGRRVWVALATVADWRWMADRHDSPWYPTMRLFRQKRLDDWDELMMRVAVSVAGAMGQRRNT